MLTYAAILLAVLTCARIVTADVTAASCTVRLRPQASVKGTTLVLADIADLSGDDEALVARLARTSLGSISSVRLLNRGEVLALIRHVLPNPGDVLLTGADFTRVTVATRTPEAAEIAAILKAHFVDISSWRDEEIEIRAINNLGTIELPQAGAELRVASRTMPANCRSALVAIQAILDGKLIRTFWVKADVRVRARVVQVVRPVPYGHALQADDLQEAVCEIEDPRLNHFRTADEAVGMTVKRPLAPGDLLDRGAVVEVQLVRSGETVRLVVQGSEMKVAVLARALQNGKLGDQVRVRNIDSDRVVMAVVTGRGEVRVAN